jgi:hypothetical protein
MIAVRLPHGLCATLRAHPYPEEFTMRRLFPPLALLMLLSVMPVAAAPGNTPPPVQSPPAGAAMPARDVPADGGQKAAAPAATFTPSEKIGADSAVTFPVDI